MRAVHSVFEGAPASGEESYEASFSGSGHVLIIKIINPSHVQLN